MSVLGTLHERAFPVDPVLDQALDLMEETARNLGAWFAHCDRKRWTDEGYYLRKTILQAADELELFAARVRLGVIR